MRKPLPSANDRDEQQVVTRVAACAAQRPRATSRGMLSSRSVGTEVRAGAGSVLGRIDIAAQEHIRNPVEWSVDQLRAAGVAVGQTTHAVRGHPGTAAAPEVRRIELGDLQEALRRGWSEQGISRRPGALVTGGVGIRVDVREVDAVGAADEVGDLFEHREIVIGFRDGIEHEVIGPSAAGQQIRPALTDDGIGAARAADRVDVRVADQLVVPAAATDVLEIGERLVARAEIGGATAEWDGV